MMMAKSRGTRTRIVSLLPWVLLLWTKTLWLFLPSSCQGFFDAHYPLPSRHGSRLTTTTTTTTLFSAVEKPTEKKTLAGNDNNNNDQADAAGLLPIKRRLGLSQATTRTSQTMSQAAANNKSTTDGSMTNPAIWQKMQESSEDSPIMAQDDDMALLLSKQLLEAKNTTAFALSGGAAKAAGTTPSSRSSSSTAATTTTTRNNITPATHAVLEKIRDILAENSHSPMAQDIGKALLIPVATNTTLNTGNTTFAATLPLPRGLTPAVSARPGRLDQMAQAVSSHSQQQQQQSTTTFPSTTVAGWKPQRYTTTTTKPPVSTDPLTIYKQQYFSSRVAESRRRALMQSLRHAKQQGVPMATTGGLTALSLSSSSSLPQSRPVVPSSTDNGSTSNPRQEYFRDRIAQSRQRALMASLQAVQGQTWVQQTQPLSASSASASPRPAKVSLRPPLPPPSTTTTSTTTNCASTSQTEHFRQKIQASRQRVLQDNAFHRPQVSATTAALIPTKVASPPATPTPLAKSPPLEEKAAPPMAKTLPVTPKFPSRPLAKPLQSTASTVQSKAPQITPKPHGSFDMSNGPSSWSPKKPTANVPPFKKGAISAMAMTLPKNPDPPKTATGEPNIAPGTFGIAKMYALATAKDEPVVPGTIKSLGPNATAPFATKMGVGVGSSATSQQTAPVSSPSSWSASSRATGEASTPPASSLSPNKLTSRNVTNSLPAWSSMGPKGGSVSALDKAVGSTDVTRSVPTKTAPFNAAFGNNMASKTKAPWSSPGGNNTATPAPWAPGKTLSGTQSGKVGFKGSLNTTTSANGSPSQTAAPRAKPNQNISPVSGWTPSGATAMINITKAATSTGFIPGTSVGNRSSAFDGASVQAKGSSTTVTGNSWVSNSGAKATWTPSGPLKTVKTVNSSTFPTYAVAMNRNSNGTAANIASGKTGFESPLAPSENGPTVGSEMKSKTEDSKIGSKNTASFKPVSFPMKSPSGPGVLMRKTTSPFLPQGGKVVAAPFPKTNGPKGAAWRPAESTDQQLPKNKKFPTSFDSPFSSTHANMNANVDTIGPILPGNVQQRGTGTPWVSGKKGQAPDKNNTPVQNVSPMDTTAVPSVGAVKRVSARVPGKSSWSQSNERPFRAPNQGLQKSSTTSLGTQDAAPSGVMANPKLKAPWKPSTPIGNMENTTPKTPGTPFDKINTIPGGGEKPGVKARSTNSYQNNFKSSEENAPWTQTKAPAIGNTASIDSVPNQAKEFRATNTTSRPPWGATKSSGTSVFAPKKIDRSATALKEEQSGTVTKVNGSSGALTGSGESVGGVPVPQGKSVEEMKQLYAQYQKMVSTGKPETDNKAERAIMDPSTTLPRKSSGWRAPSIQAFQEATTQNRGNPVVPKEKSKAFRFSILKSDKARNKDESDVASTSSESETNFFRFPIFTMTDSAKKDKSGGVLKVGLAMMGVAALPTVVLPMLEDGSLVNSVQSATSYVEKLLSDEQTQKSYDEAEKVGQISSENTMTKSVPHPHGGSKLDQKANTIAAEPIEERDGAREVVSTVQNIEEQKLPITGTKTAMETSQSMAKDKNKELSVPLEKETETPTATNTIAIPEPNMKTDGNVDERILPSEVSAKESLPTPAKADEKLTGSATSPRDEGEFDKSELGVVERAMGAFQTKVEGIAAVFEGKSSVADSEDVAKSPSKVTTATEKSGENKDVESGATQPTMVTSEKESSTSTDKAPFPIADDSKSDQKTVEPKAISSTAEVNAAKPSDQFQAKAEVNPAPSQTSSAPGSAHAQISESTIAQASLAAAVAVKASEVLKDSPTKLQEPPLPSWDFDRINTESSQAEAQYLRGMLDQYAKEHPIVESSSDQECQEMSWLDTIMERVNESNQDGT